MVFPEPDNEDETQKLIPTETASEAESLENPIAPSNNTQNKNLSAKPKPSLLYRIFSMAWFSVTNTLKVGSEYIGQIAQVIPILNAIISGIVCLIDISEAVLMNRETRGHKKIKMLNSSIGIGLAVTAATLAFFSATAPLAVTFSAIAMFAACVNETYFWKTKQKELNQLKLNLASYRNQLDQEVNQLLQSHYHVEAEQIKNLNQKIRELQDKEDPESLKNLSVLQESKQALLNSLDEKINQQESIVKIRAAIKDIKLDIALTRSERNLKRTNFFNNLVSLAGTILLAVFAFALAGAIVTNPIGLGIAGTVLIGISTLLAIKHKLFPKKEPTPEDMVTPEASEQKSLPSDNTPSNQPIKKTVSDTEHIVYLLLTGTEESTKRESEKKILHSVLTASTLKENEISGTYEKDEPASNDTEKTSLIEIKKSPSRNGFN